MCEAKTLTPLELVGIGSSFAEVLETAQNMGYRNVGKRNWKLGIDSIRSTPLKATIKSIATQTGWKLEKVQSHTKISAHAKRKTASKEITSLWRLMTKSGFGNILLETPNELNQSSDHKKYKLTIFGLSQPNKPLSNATLEELHSLLKRLEVIELDICIDSNNALNLEALNTFGAIDTHYTTSYLHMPRGLSYITKLCYYNKQAKDNLLEPLYRLELTCKTRGHIGTLFVPINEIKTILDRF